MMLRSLLLRPNRDLVMVTDKVIVSILRYRASMKHFDQSSTFGSKLLSSF